MKLRVLRSWLQQFIWWIQIQFNEYFGGGLKFLVLLLGLKFKSKFSVEPLHRQFKFYDASTCATCIYLYDVMIQIKKQVNFDKKIGLKTSSLWVTLNNPYPRSVWNMSYFWSISSKIYLFFNPFCNYS